MLAYQVLPRLVALLMTGYHLVGAELVDVPEPSNFIRSKNGKATVLGDYVYVDGLEVSQLVDGQLTDRLSNPINSTLSIDLSKSWNTSTVTINATPKTGPIKTNSHLWTNVEAGEFYVWGGHWPWGENMTETELWKFTVDGQGGGEWSAEPPANPSLFDGLHPSEFGAFTTVRDTGYVIGGTATAWTEYGRCCNQVIPGILTFDMKTKVWKNGTTDFSPFETLYGAGLVTIPVFGPNGLILALGGAAPRFDQDQPIGEAKSFDLQNLTFFDPQTNEKYWQITRGDAPPWPRTKFCTAGFENDVGGYDIFIFGGANDRDQYTYEDAYVLTLPGFAWTKVPDPPAGPRTGHSCVAIGNRQVLSIGGLNSFTDKPWEQTDAAHQGLLLFDMTEMEWLDTYNADAAPYQSHQSIRDWSPDTVDWSSDEVKSLFDNGNSTSADSNSDSTSKAPVAAIAGGVVGGVAGLSIMAGIAWLLIRRKKGRQGRFEQGGDSPPRWMVAEVEANQQPQEVSTDGSVYKIAPSTPAELYQEVNELPGTELRRAELDGNASWHDAAKHKP